MTPLLVILMLFFVPAHDYYVGHTSIKYSEKNSSLELTTKLFTDDLLEVVDAQNNDIFEPMLRQYMQNHLVVYLNGQKKAEQLVWVGFEQEGDVTWIYQEIQRVKRLNEIKVSNKLLIDFFEQQSNIVQVTVGNQTKGMLFDSRETQKITTF